jgi:integrase
MVANPTGKRRPKRSHHGDGTAPFKRTDRWRRKPWVTVVPYTDESGRRREMWLSAASKPEAEALRKRELARLRKGIIPTHETVVEYMSAWLETVEVGPGTWPRYQSHLSERIAPSLGDIALDRLTPQAVRSAVIRWSGSAATRAGTLRLLRAAMKQAVLDRRIEHDPTAGIPYPRSRRRQSTTLTGPEAKQLISTVQGERFGPILVVSLGLGVRRGEALGLRTADLDFAAREVTIAKGLRYIPPALRSENEGPYRLTSTKSGDTRTLPLPDFVLDTLRERIEQRDQEKHAARVYAPNDFVFCDPLGNTVPLETLYRWFKSMLGRAGLPDMRWHDLRGSTATLLAEMGVDVETIRRILGHRDIATTLLYVGKTPTALREAADKMGRAIG